ncbi:hydrogenase maturation nickel metallochaperone HypA [Nitrosococcus oceani]|uniref:hydrogenase maturation nickel metallochaperone HypA n=1 Tax=Nitrosococcus oceani TaxID=1229 RepID=UPI0004E90B89|nr:hydrogenase maturation nickel metallochaperone HypA [Nitrosococcus oceani]KFI21623.1 hypothetical protein HW44_14050 [Nitrosococcus oceani]
MHELSLMADLFRKITDISRANDNGKVAVVRVKRGALSPIMPDHFIEYFVEFSKGTPAEGAKLEITQIEDLHDPNIQDILLDSVELTA